MALVLLEDFLSCYDGTPLEACTTSEQIELSAAAVDLLRRDPVPYAEVEPNENVAAGLRVLFEDLSRAVFGIDPNAVSKLVRQLPRDQGWALAVGGYGVRAGEPLGAPFYALTLDVFQLALGQRAWVVWLSDMDHLRRLLEDPKIERLALMGHGASRSYAFEGLTGEPTATLARLLQWSGGHVRRWSRVLGQASRGNTQPLDEFIGGELSLQWRRWGERENQSLLQSGSYQPKDEIVIYACCVNELSIRVKPTATASGQDIPPWELASQLQRMATVDDPAASWLGFGRSVESVTLHPLTPAMWETFVERIPRLV